MTSHASPLSAVDQFERDGYLILDQLFSEREISEMSKEVDCIIEGHATYMPESDTIWEPAAEPKRLRNAFRMHAYHQPFLNVAKSPQLVTVISEILGNPVRLYGSQIFAKPPRVGSAVPDHQDMPYWPFAPFEMITAWIALDDSSIENGCVRMRAGSHHLGLLPHGTTQVKGNSLGLLEHPDLTSLPEHPIEVRRGSCVLHHCLTVHRSEPNTSDKARRGLIYIYMSPNVRLTDPSRLRGPAIFPVVSE